jgi:hypothetical protein
MEWNSNIVLNMELKSNPNEEPEEQPLPRDVFTIVQGRGQDGGFGDYTKPNWSQPILDENGALIWFDDRHEAEQTVSELNSMSFERFHAEHEDTRYSGDFPVEYAVFTVRLPENPAESHESAISKITALDEYRWSRTTDDIFDENADIKDEYIDQYEELSVPLITKALQYFDVDMSVYRNDPDIHFDLTEDLEKYALQDRHIIYYFITDTNDQLIGLYFINNGDKPMEVISNMHGEMFSPEFFGLSDGADHSEWVRAFRNHVNKTKTDHEQDHIERNHQ